MRVPVLALVVALVPFLAAAWTAEDHEIFRLHDDVIAHEGSDATFYSFIGVPRNAKIEDINRAYRNKGKRIHPDKARQSYLRQYAKDNAAKATGKDSTASNKPTRPSDRELNTFMKEAGERFARLGTIAEIMRGPTRDRYDFFLDHGFPKWRGTGYYYQRYRPGLGTVLVGLFVVMGGFAHYGALILSWKRQRDFAEKYIRDARKLAWGKESIVPGLDTISTPGVPNGSVGMNGNGNGSASTAGMNRKQKRAQEKENRKSTKKGGVSTDDISAPVETSLISGPQRTKRRVVAENGKTLIVDSVGNVFLEETTDEGETHEYLIDINEISKPTMHDTVLVKLPLWVWRKTGGRLISSKAEPPMLADSDLTEEEETEPALQSATASSPNAEAMRRRKAKVRPRP